MQKINVLLLTSKIAGLQPFPRLLSDSAVHYLGAMDIQKLWSGDSRELNPDVVLLFESSGKPNYHRLVPRAKAYFDPARLLVLGEGKGDDTVMKVVSLGGDGYMASSASSQHLLCAIKDCERGIIWAPRRVLSEMVRRLGPSRPPSLSSRALQKMITAREADVVDLLIRGLTNKDIAGALGVQEITIKVHISSLLRKLKFKNRCALVSSIVAGRLHN
ncbi:MAG: response regulator transcription factor [Acidobacteria bacterium]|nr:response regulator transcription factor [Acidobacteriota bacterium]